MAITKEDIGEKESVWQIVADILKKYGSLDVFPPAMHKGECTTPYIVLAEDGQSNIVGYTAMYRYFRVMIYVPRDEYSKLDAYESEVRKVMQENVFPLLLPVGTAESDYYDANYDAHLRALLYRNVYRDKHV